jgi:hypothetical protein
VPGLDPERRGELVPVPSSPSRVGQTDGFVRTAVPFMMRRDGGPRGRDSDGSGAYLLAVGTGEELVAAARPVNPARISR